LNEENERSITVEVGAPPSKPGPVETPQVVDLRVKPPGKVGEPVFAPATFQFQATVDNAEHFVWDFGDGKGIQLADFAVAHTFDAPGTYNVKLAAFNGKERAVEEATIRVLPPPVGALSLTLRVQDGGVEVIEQRRTHKASKTVRVGKKGPETLELSIPATTGFEITQVEKKNSQNDNVQKTEWKIANDRKFAKVVGQLPKLNVPYDAVLNEQLVIVEQRRQPANGEPVPLTHVVATPGSTTLRLPSVPSEWTEVQRHVAYELRDGDRIVWQGDRAPQNAAITVRGKPYHFTATVATDRVEVSIQ
jgi:PKD repeat protein